MLCKYCTVGYWVAMLLALGGFIFCTVLISVYGWELSGYGWMTKGIMLSIAIVLAVGLTQVQKNVSVLSAWALSVVGFGIAIWRKFAPHTVCDLDCDKPIFMIGTLGMTPIITSLTLFGILVIMFSVMLVKNKR